MVINDADDSGCNWASVCVWERRNDRVSERELCATASRRNECKFINFLCGTENVKSARCDTEKKHDDGDGDGEGERGSRWRINTKFTRNAFAFLDSNILMAFRHFLPSLIVNSFTFYVLQFFVFGAYGARANSEHTGFSHFTLLFRKMYLQRRARPLTVTVTVTVHRQFTYTCIFLSFCLIQSILLRLSAASKIERRSQRRKVCLCSRDHSHSSSSSAHFILEQFSFRFFSLVLLSKLVVACEWEFYRAV